MKRILVLLFVLSIVFTGCPIIEPEEEVVSIQTNEVYQGFIVKQNGISITNSSTYDVGGVELSNSQIFTFTIGNMGSNTISLTGTKLVSIIDEDDSSVFEITSMPNLTTFVQGAESTFKIKYTPTNLNSCTNVISIPNSDISNVNYTFTIIAEGVDTTNPFVYVYPIEEVTDTNNYYVSITNYDSQSGIQNKYYQLDTDNVIEFTTNGFNLTNLSLGNHTIKVWITDYANNVSDTNSIDIFVMTNCKPIIILDNEQTRVPNDIVTLYADVSDLNTNDNLIYNWTIDTYDISLNNANTTNMSFIMTNLVDEYVFTLTVFDGKISNSKSITIYTATEGLIYTTNLEGTIACSNTNKLEYYDIIIPSKYTDLPVTSIEHSAFIGCTNITNVIISDSILIIKNSAFLSCDYLTSIKIPDSVTNIENGVFFYCNNLTNVKMMSSNPCILGGNSVFYNNPIIQVPSDSLNLYTNAMYWKDQNIVGY
jgi:hypothetical protein